MTHLHHITSEIVKREPSFICIEDLNVKWNDEEQTFIQSSSTTGIL